MRYKKTIIQVFLLICFCAVSFIAGIKYNNSQKLNQYRKYYINRFYYELDNTIQLLSSAGDWKSYINNTDITTNPYKQFLFDLNSMRVINEQWQLYMINDRDSSFLNNLAQSFRLIEDGIGSGMSLNNQQVCYDFLKDGIMSKNEISFLISLKQNLQSMKSNLYSGDTKQENPNLTMNEVAKAVKSFTDKYSVSNLNNIGLRN